MNIIHRQQGSILLEALIAFLIFAMGILGVIGLQANAINNTLDTSYRSDAAFLANQIISQMWVDPDNSTAPPSLKSTYACNPCTSSNGNSYTQAWVSQIQGAAATSAASAVPGMLPGGSSGTANQPSIAISGAQATVTLNWQSPKTGAATHSYVTQSTIKYN